MHPLVIIDSRNKGIGEKDKRSLNQQLGDDENIKMGVPGGKTWDISEGRWRRLDENGNTDLSS